MRCNRTHTTRRALLDLELGALTPAPAEDLRAHLASCVDCAQLARQERLLTCELAGLRLELPFELNVTARVLEAVQAAPSARREAVSPTSLAWASAAATVAGLALALALWSMLPGLTPLASAATDLLAPVGGALVKLAGAALDVLLVPLKMLWSLVGKLPGLLDRLAPWQPLLGLAVGLGYGLMAAVITLFVGRDLQQARVA